MFSIANQTRQTFKPLHQTKQQHEIHSAPEKSAGESRPETRPPLRHPAHLPGPLLPPVGRRARQDQQIRPGVLQAPRLRENRQGARQRRQLRREPGRPRVHDAQAQTARQRRRRGPGSQSLAHLPHQARPEEPEVGFRHEAEAELARALHSEGLPQGAEKLEPADGLATA